MSRLESCGSCTGSGIKAGTSASTCSTCGGSGQVVQAVRTPLGVFQQVCLLTGVILPSLFVSGRGLAMQQQSWRCWVLGYGCSKH